MRPACLNKITAFIFAWIISDITMATALTTCDATALTYMQKIQIKRFVHQAKAYVKRNGIQQASKEFMTSRFIHDNLYIFVIDNKIYSLANGGRPDFIGKDLTRISDAQDSAGKIVTKAKQGGGWVSYHWKDPQTHRLQCKTSWVTPFLKDSRSNQFYTIGSGINH
ncbi:MAG: cache domain-containing protein [Legionellaceae bacterium]|nr:cache domain-containing protein [Legionellaceae bacterium]